MHFNAVSVLFSIVLSDGTKMPSVSSYYRLVIDRMLQIMTTNERQDTKVQYSAAPFGSVSTLHFSSPFPFFK